MRTTQAFAIALTMDSHGLYQERIDQSSAGRSDGEKDTRDAGPSDAASLLRTTLAGTFHFEPGIPSPATTRFSPTKVLGTKEISDGLA